MSENAPDATCVYCHTDIDYVRGEAWVTWTTGDETCPDNPNGHSDQ